MMREHYDVGGGDGLCKDLSSSRHSLAATTSHVSIVAGWAQISLSPDSLSCDFPLPPLPLPGRVCACHRHVPPPEKLYP